MASYGIGVGSYVFENSTFSLHLEGYYSSGKGLDIRIDEGSSGNSMDKTDIERASGFNMSYTIYHDDVNDYYFIAGCKITIEKTDGEA